MQSDFAVVPTHRTGRAVTLALSGELDLVSSPALSRAIDDLAGSDLELLIVDLRGLVFMDSTGLHALIRAQNQVQESGRRFALVRGPEQVQRLFDLTGLTDALTIVDSPEYLLDMDPAPRLPDPATG
jgi:anti-sigma B factor antagonist